MIYGPDTPLYLRLYLTLKSKFAHPYSPVGASPERTETMTSDDAKKYIDGVHKAQDISLVDISGGEPFLYYDEMLNILGYAKKKGVPAKVTTSAFWASNPEKSAWIIQQLKKSGVDRLEIRFDSMYAANVSFDRIKNAALAARQKGLIVQVVSNYLHPMVETWSDKGRYEGETTNKADGETAELQARLLEFLPKRCLGWERAKLADNDKKLMDLLGERFAEARLASARALDSRGDQNGRIDTSVNVNILPNGELEVNGRHMGNARAKEAEIMVRDFIIESRMAF
jgi:organic radical activating enzyme